MTFAREASVFVIPLAAIAIAAQAWAVHYQVRWLTYIALFFGVAAIGVLLFFRDPNRTIPAGDELVLAPADGRVLLSETIDDGRQRIAIFMSVFNVHVNRCPVSGKIEKIDTVPGNYFNAASDKAAMGNAQVMVHASTRYGPVIWKQISGLIARKISCRLTPGDEVQSGAKFGLIYFGSRMEVFLPSTATLVAKPGDTVRAGETIIAKFAN